MAAMINSHISTDTMMQGQNGSVWLSVMSKAQQDAFVEFIHGNDHDYNKMCLL